MAVAFVLGALPPLALWFAYQRAATGSFFTTAQELYYATSDGPPGCFRYGFGAGIGCHGEHGDFVAHNLASGYGLVAALGTTGRRLLHHVSDVLNFAPLALLPFAAIRRGPFARALFVAVVAQIAAYAPFYFDGSYPGGGARMFADALPFEHALLALALAGVARAERAPRFGRALGAILGLSLFGFALSAGADHAALRDREGGRPMFEPSALRAAGVGPNDLVLFDTDHGFDLAFAPGRPVARYHGDAIDRLVWERFGRPRAFRYGYRMRDPAEVRLEPLAFDPARTADLPLVIGAGSLWPPVAQAGGWAWPAFDAGSCGESSRELRIHGDAQTRVILRIPSDAAGRSIAVTLTSNLQPFEITLLIDGEPLHTWLPANDTVARCIALDAVDVPPGARRIELATRGAGWGIYSVELGEKR